nr:hypothetical protein [uncultured Pedobacter sp.]
MSLENWNQISKQNGCSSVASCPKFIEIVRNSYRLRSLQYIIYDQDTPILGIVLYLKKNNVVHPSQYFYTTIWENSKSKLIIQNAYILLIEDLTSKFKNIRFRFSPEIIDIRPFLLKGFSSIVNYTYYKDLLKLEFGSKLLARERKALALGMKFNWNFNTKIVDQNIQGLKELGYKDDFVKPLEKMLRLLYENDFIMGVSADIDGTMVGSALVMIDKENDKAMNILITSEKRNYDTGLHTALYINIFNKLKENNIVINDLYGANVLGIGNFKANFGAELMPHYTLDFSYVKNKCKRILKKTFRMLKLIGK